MVQAVMYTYLLVVVGFLIKGLPSQVFQAFVLMVYFISKRKFKVLFYKAHFAGMGVMLLLLGGYYYIYFRQVNLPAVEFFTRLITESTDRTVVNAAIFKSVLYIISPVNHKKRVVNNPYAESIYLVQLKPFCYACLSIPCENYFWF